MKFEKSFNYTAHARLLEKLRSYAEFELNSLLNSYQNYFLFENCSKILLTNITLVVFYIEDEFYRIRFTSSTKKSMIFQIDFYINSYYQKINRDWDSNKIETWAINSHPVQIRV